MESPFSRYLHTNYVPRDAEVKAIRSHLVAHTLEVSRLEALILDLSTQRQKKLEYIGAHEALMSPARRMPQDVMQEVFLACAPAQRNAVMSTKDVPLLLTRICKSWRILALSTPALWASLHIPLEYILDMIGTQHPLDWLERSGRAPLSLTVIGARTMNHWEEYEHEGVDEAFRMLSGCADRWRSVELSFEMTEGLSHLANVYAPALEAVKIRGPEAEVLGLKMLTTPSLREVTLKILQDFDRLISQLPLTWNNLTHLTFQTMGRYKFVGLSPNVALEILQRCPRIISFKSNIRDFLDGSHFPESMPQPTPLILPAIQELVLLRSSALNTTSVLYLLHHLSMPQLRQLQLPRTIAGRSPLPFLGDLATRSPLIESIDVDLAGLTHDSLVETLTGLPVLKRLVVVDYHNQGRDEGATVLGLQFTFLAQDRQPPTLQLLTEMEFQMCRLHDENGLLDLARHLLHRDGSHFQRFKIEYDGWKPPISPGILADFAAQGLTISTSSVGGLISSRATVPTPTPWTGLDHPEY